MTVLQVCAYGADYGGNFIASLEALERALGARGINTIYAFVDRASNKKWCKEIEKRTRVYYLPESKARIRGKTYRAFRRIYKENSIDIVHSHFELYDIPATIMAPKGVKHYWHLHDPIDISKQKFSRKLLTKLQYGFVGKKAYLLSVSDEYRKRIISLGFPEINTSTVLNGLDISKIDYTYACTSNRCYDFLTFGWDFIRKGGDVIIEACDKLEKDGYSFKLLFNGNGHTWPKLESYLNGRSPAYLIKGNPVENINELFKASGVFIQASRRETFSYAVCEAAYAGLPVITTDIDGLEWAHNLPSVSFVRPDDSNALYAEMKKFLEGKSLSCGEIEKTREIIKENYSVLHWVDEILRYYNE